MSKLSRAQALEQISNWSSEHVLSLLRKNDLEECCATIDKRQINGDSLLHLTEGKLALWKNDLSRPLKWKLWSFVEELKKCPEQYVKEDEEATNNGEYVSEGGSWDSDFDDDEDEHDFGVTEVQAAPVVISKASNNEIKKTLAFQNYHSLNNGNTVTVRTSAEILGENTYANCDNVEENEYVNLKLKNATNQIENNDSKEKSLAEQLQEQLSLLKSLKKSAAQTEMQIETSDKKDTKLQQPRSSFLHTITKSTENPVIRRMKVAPPPEPKKPVEKVEENPSKVSASIRNFDLVANLPTKTEESEDEYESFDNSNIVVSTVDNKSVDYHISTDNIYHPNSIASFDEETIDEIYESITEDPDDLYRAEEGADNSDNIPPPLPPKPSSCSSLQSLNSTSSERSPDKKSSTLPHTSSSISLPIIDRATRPLPTPPDRHSYTEKPWFHNVTREQATILIKEQSTYGNSNKDGYFLIRPSTTNHNNPLALVLWYNDRVYNVPVRKRTDNRFALGSAKPNEQSFASIEEIVSFYKQEELVLYTGGIQMGSTKLNNSPLK